MRPSRIMLGLAVAAVAGVTIFAGYAWRAVSVETREPSEAVAELAAARAALAGSKPLVVWSEGQLVVSPTPSSPSRPAPSRLQVLAWRVSSRQVVKAEVPFWFLKLKGPAVEFALRGTDFDLEALGLTSEDLERHGPGLVVDQTAANGDQLLVWME